MKEAIVLAGGFGTRLQHVVPDVPKPMAPVCGRPFLEILLDSLLKNGVDRVILALGFKADLVIAHFGHRYRSLEIVYSVESSPLGTGGALAAALELGRDLQQLVVNGDTYLDLELNEVRKLWQAHHDPIIVVRKVADTARFGRVTVDEGIVRTFGEKSGSGPGLINAGCYVLPRGLLASSAPASAFSFEKDYVAQAVTTTTFRAFLTAGSFIDIGVPEDYAAAQLKLVSVARDFG